LIELQKNFQKSVVPQELQNLINKKLEKLNAGFGNGRFANFSKFSTDL
jgi:hypothetical protein